MTTLVRFSACRAILPRWNAAALLVLVLGGQVLPLLGQVPAVSVRLNQVGFYPAAPKLAVVAGAAAGEFFLVSEDRQQPLFTGTLGPPRQTVTGSETVRAADFSGFTTPGTYVLQTAAGQVSAPFQIQRRVHEAVARAALKSYYFQRASIALPAQFAGRWNRPLGHPDTRVLIHPSAASAQRPAGTVIACPRGWYDAGDYNKYVVNSGITLGTLLSLYEDFPEYCAALRTDIPESTNQVPDLLDEALWNLRWMLTMQDPEDGGVYHKLTNAGFDGMVMPEQAGSPRYVVQKSTAAALNLAAVMAQAGRVLRPFNHQLPGLADSCLRAAARAWRWAETYPAVYYRQAGLNQQYAPAITTGEYGDQDVRDERAWAAAELYVTTRKLEYYRALLPALAAPAALPAWNQVQTLAYFTLARFPTRRPARAQPAWTRVRSHLLTLANALVKNQQQQAYQTVFGQTPADYGWGSNATAANQGIALLQAYRLSGDKRYLHSALATLDYLLGRNATGYCFLTGVGSKSPQHPHHRLAEADGISEPLPGFLVGGPNPGRQDNCHYPFLQADKSYVDEACSYASNEVAINWNAPLVYLAAALEALHSPGGSPAFFRHTGK